MLSKSATWQYMDPDDPVRHLTSAQATCYRKVAQAAATMVADQVLDQTETAVSDADQARFDGAVADLSTALDAGDLRHVTQQLVDLAIEQASQGPAVPNDQPANA